MLKWKFLEYFPMLITRQFSQIFLVTHQLSPRCMKTIAAIKRCITLFLSNAVIGIFALPTGKSLTCLRDCKKFIRLYNVIIQKYNFDMLVFQVLTMAVVVVFSMIESVLLLVPTFPIQQ